MYGGEGGDQPRTEDFVESLRRIVGARHVLTAPEDTRKYRIGFRSGGGPAVAVVRPQSLVELWRVVQLCVDADKIVIMQAANTGLTGGSTPDGSDYDRDVVIVNAMSIDDIHVIDDGRRVICLPGATLYGLEAKLRPYDREPHSVIGSSCIGASVFGGVCNNSGGALVRRGPAYTELALYAQLGADGVLRLVNHLGVRLAGTAEQILDRLEHGNFTPADIEPSSGRHASDMDYHHRVRDLDSAVPARFNADPRRLFEGSGSAGRLVLFAVCLDTFPKDKQTAVFYVGTNDPAELTQLRRSVLSRFQNMPVTGEYMHRDCFDLSEQYGKDTFYAVRCLGINRLRILFYLKAKLDGWAERFGLRAGSSDRWLQWLSQRLPAHLPSRIKAFRDQYEHHLILKMADEGIEEAGEYLGQSFPSRSGDFFLCTDEEGDMAFLHRFAAAGAAVRFRAVHEESVEDIVAVDVALPRNTLDWLEVLPMDISETVLYRLYYGHFFCYVFHQDYIIRKGINLIEFKHRIMALLDARGGEYPAEHNVGHLYAAKPALQDFYRALDPLNSFNPGIGQTSKRRSWK